MRNLILLVSLVASKLLAAFPIQCYNFTTQKDLTDEAKEYIAYQIPEEMQKEAGLVDYEFRKGNQGSISLVKVHQKGNRKREFVRTPSGYDLIVEPEQLDSWFQLDRRIKLNSNPTLILYVKRNKLTVKKHLKPGFLPLLSKFSEKKYHLSKGELSNFLYQINTISQLKFQKQSIGTVMYIGDKRLIIIASPDEPLSVVIFAFENKDIYNEFIKFISDFQ